MKLRSYTLTIAMLVCLVGAASAAMAAPGAQPLSISETKVDFGSMTEGPVATKTVTLTNASKEVVTIQNVTTSCSCTSTTLGQTSLEPGETTELVINYHTFKYPGKFDKTVTIFTGKGEEESQVIHIVGYVNPIPMGVMEVEPRKVELGALEVGKANKVSLTVANAGDAPMEISAVKSQKFDKTYWEGKKTVEAGKSAALDLELTPGEVGRYLDIIMVYSDARNDIGKGYKVVLVGEAQ